MSQTFLNYKSLNFHAICIEIIKRNVNRDLFNILRQDENLKFRLYYIAFIKLLRKPIEYMAGKDLNDPEVLAQVIHDAMPSQSPHEIKQKALNAFNNFDNLYDEIDQNKRVLGMNALKTYADCLEFKHKELTSNDCSGSDIILANTYYNKAALLFEPEAMTMCAYRIFTQIITHLAVEKSDVIPFNCKFTPCRELLENMWYFLEKCCDQGYVTRFFITQAQDARKTGSWDLPHICKRKLVEVEVAEMRRCMDNLNLNATNNFIDNVVKNKIARYIYPTLDDNSDGFFDGDGQLDPDARKLSTDERQSMFGNIQKAIKMKAHRDRFERASYENVLISIRSDLISGKLTVDELIKRGDIRFQRNGFQSALTFYAMAIDQLETKYMEVFQMSNEIQIKFATILAKRARCNLKIGEIRHCRELFSLAECDATFVLNERVFNENVLGQELEDNLKQIKSQAVQRINDIEQFEQRRVESVNIEPSSSLHESLATEDNTVDSNKKIDIVLNNSFESNEYKLKYEIDHCPSCLVPWKEMSESSIIVILPCDHAVCAPCLHKLHERCKKRIPNSNASQSFSCPECRFKLKNDTVNECAKMVVKKNLVESLNQMSMNLNMNSQNRKKLIEKWLIKFVFNVCQVESKLIDYICLITPHILQEKEEEAVSLNQASTLSSLEYVTSQPISHEEKEQYYKLARAPVSKLEQDFEQVQNDIDTFRDIFCEEYQEKIKERQLIENNLKQARINASNDIFERINSRGNMGVWNEEDNTVSFDFHGMHVIEAKTKLDDLVLPVVSVFSQVYLVTGYGVHSETQQATLKHSIKKYVTAKKFVCENDTANKGRLCVREK